MDLIEVGNLKVSPFELERILEIRMDKKMNEHATLYLRGVIQDGLEDTIVTDVTESTPIQFQHGDKVIFNGLLQDINVTCENKVYYLEATAISHSILLDLKPMKRSFQEKGMEFKAIAEHVIQGAKAKMAFDAPVKAVENLMLQYNETDWQFVKRLASHSNSVLIPAADSEGPEFLFGVPEGVEYKDKLDVFNYSVSKDMSLFRQLSQSSDLNFTEGDAVIYTMETDDFIFDLGDMLGLNGSALYVYDAGLHLVDSVLTCTYRLSTKNALSVPKSYNKDIAGLTLTGSVLKAEGDKVKVHLAIDEGQEEGKAYPFPYATTYTAEGHTGWYVMPEVGDTVQVLFPTEDENGAYSDMAIRQADSDKTTDPLVKYLRTPFGKEVKLEKEEILITAKDGTTFIKINETSGIDIITDKAVQVNAGGSISVTAGDTISMKSTNDFTINSGKNLNISAADSITMTCRDNSVKLETPASGIEIDAKKPIKVTGGGTMDVKSKGKFTATVNDAFQLSVDKKLGVSSKETIEMVCKDNSVKLESGGSGILLDSGKAIKVTGKDKVDITSKSDLTASSSKDLKVSASQKLALSGDSAIEASSKGSSIKMDGDINMKAKLIKEN